MFCIIIWMAYSSVVTVRLSSLLRTIVADATAYFIMAMALQILVVLFLSFADVRRPLSALTLLTHPPSGYDQPIPTYVRTPLSDLRSLTNSWDLIAYMQCEFPWNCRCNAWLANVDDNQCNLHPDQPRRTFAQEDGGQQ
jgi:hypothetical protein